MVPYLTVFVPDAPVEHIPPIEALAPGSIGKKSPVSLKNKFKPGAPLLLHDEPIFKNDKIVGYTTSSNFSFCYYKNICLGYVQGDIKDKENLFIEVEGKRYPLHLEKNPLHDPTSKLLRS